MSTATRPTTHSSFPRSSLHSLGTLHLRHLAEKDFQLLRDKTTGREEQSVGAQWLLYIIDKRGSCFAELLVASCTYTSWPRFQLGDVVRRSKRCGNTYQMIWRWAQPLAQFRTPASPHDNFSLRLWKLFTLSLVAIREQTSPPRIHVNIQRCAARS